MISLYFLTRVKTPSSGRWEENKLGQLGPKTWEGKGGGEVAEIFELVNARRHSHVLNQPSYSVATDKSISSFKLSARGAITFALPRLVWNAPFTKIEFLVCQHRQLGGTW